MINNIENKRTLNSNINPIRQQSSIKSLIDLNLESL